MALAPEMDAAAVRATSAPPAWQAWTETVLGLGVTASRTLAIFGGLLIVASGVLICIEVVLRKFAGITTAITDEYSSYAFAIGATLAFSHCLVERAHIRIDSATAWLGPRIKLAIDLVALASLPAFFSLVAWFAVDTAWTSYRQGSRAVTQLQTPLFIPQGLWALALVLFVLVGIAVLAAALARLAGGDAAGARRLVATRSTEAEAEVQL